MKKIKTDCERMFSIVDADSWHERLLAVGYEGGAEGDEGSGELDFGKVRETLPWGDSHAAGLLENELLLDTVAYDSDDDLCYVWNGKIHTPVAGSYVAEEIADRFYREYEKVLDTVQEGIEETIKKFKTNSEKDKAVRAEAVRLWKEGFKKHKAYRDALQKSSGRSSLAKDIKRRLTQDCSAFHNDLDYFVFNNGVIETKKLINLVKNGGGLADIEIKPHEQYRKVTRLFNADFDGENLGHWDNFLKGSIPEEDSREFLQATVGAAFFGETKLRTCLVLLGAPSSGKSVILDTFGKLGSGKYSRYAVPNVSSDSIMKTDGKNFSRAEFREKRIIGISEPDADKRLDGEFIKTFTGDDTVMLEAKYGQPTESVAQGLIIMAANDLPRLDSSDSAILRRIKIVRFPYSFVDSHSVFVGDQRVKDYELPQKIMDDRNRVLEWVVEGMLLYLGKYNTDLENNAPRAIDKEMSILMDEVRTPINFCDYMIGMGGISYVSNLDEIVQIPLSQLLPISEAFNAYRRWCSVNGDNYPLGRRKFTRMILADYGYDGFSQTVKSSEMRFPFFVKEPKFDQIVSKLNN